MKTIYSPLRYPGGKSKVLNFMKELIDNNFQNKKPAYVEPYAGGAGVALGLLIEGHVSRIYINDLDKAIYSFWWCIKNNPKKFIKKIKETPITVKEWQKQKIIYKKSDMRNKLALGFSAFFLNRCNISGVLGGGCIGGLKQKGPYKINCRFKKDYLIERIETIAKHRKNIHLYNKDTYELLSKNKNKFKNCLLYLDPPYYEKGNQLYKNHYKHEDHEKIANLIKNLKGYWVVSYDDVPEIRSLYNTTLNKTFGLSYSAGKAKQGKEIMFFSPVFKNIPAQII